MSLDTYTHKDDETMITCASCQRKIPSFDRSDVLPDKCGFCAVSILRERAVKHEMKPFEKVPSIAEVAMVGFLKHEKMKHVWQVV